MARRSWDRATIITLLQEDAARLGRSPTAEGDWGHAKYAPDRPSECTVRRLFGSWPAALTEAGLPPNRTGFRIQWTREKVAEAMLDWVFINGRWPRSADWQPASHNYPSHTQVVRIFGGWIRAQKYAGRALTPGQIRRARLDQRPMRGAKYGQGTSRPRQQTRG